MSVFVSLVSLALLAPPAADDGAMIAKVVREICAPFIVSRDFPKALASAKAHGFSGNVTGTFASLRPAGSAHRLQISIETDDLGETIECKLLLSGMTTEAAVAAVRSAMGGTAPEVVPNLSPQYPPSHVWSGKTGGVSVASLGGTAPVVVALLPAP